MQENEKIQLFENAPIPGAVAKLAVPMMLAWYYYRRGEATTWWDHIVAFGLLIVPVALIMKQPDLGTSILVAIAGCSVIFFSGISIKAVSAVCILGLLSLPVAWNFLHDYQRERILTLIDPTTDPLGKGFHTDGNSLEKNLQIKQLYKRINALGLVDRSVVLLWLEGLSYDEIGAILGISVKNVSFKLVRIKEQLKKMSNI